MNRYFSLITFLVGCFSFGQNLEIPTVFHIVSHPDKNISAIKNINFQSVVDSVNKRINSVLTDDIKEEFKKDIGIPKIYLRLANKSGFCDSIQSVTYHSIKYQKTGLNDFDLKILKEKGYYNKNKYLNIWFVNVVDPEDENKNSGKYSSSLDGIIIDIDELGYIGLNKKDPFLLIHEIGHYLGLKHIWGYDKVNNFPLINGCDFDDGIEDTPPQEKPHIRGEYIEVLNSCDGNGKTNHQNFMDYSYDVGMFTEEQVAVMRNNLKTKRAGLLWKPNCNGNSVSILSKTKQRNKFGTRMIVNNLYPYGTITDKDMVELFNSIGIVPTKENMKKMGLEIIANDKFKDVATGEFVNQHQIYERLDLEKAKAIYETKNNSSVNLVNDVSTPIVGYGEICFTNPNYYSRKAILTNKVTGENYQINISKAGVNHGDKKTSCSTEIPIGTYKCEIYTSFTNKKIRTIYDVIISKIKREQIVLKKNGYN